MRIFYVNVFYYFLITKTMSIQKNKSEKTLTGFDNPNDPPIVPPTGTTFTLPDIIPGTHTFEDQVNFNNSVAFQGTPFIHSIGPYTPSVGTNGWKIDYIHQDGYYSILGSMVTIYFDIFFLATLDDTLPASPVTISIPIPSKFTTIIGTLCPKESYWPRMDDIDSVTFPVSLCSEVGESVVTLYAATEETTIRALMPQEGTIHLVGMMNYFIESIPPILTSASTAPTVLNSPTPPESSAKGSPTSFFSSKSEQLEL